MDFNNKVVIITGSSSGIGAAIAKRISSEGAKIVITGRNEEKLKKVSAALKGEYLIIVADLTKEDSAKDIVSKTIDKFGRIDVLINNAGAGYKASFLDERALSIYDKIEKINLRSVISLSHEAAKHLIESKGSIINISSIAAFKAIPTSWAYCTAKAELEHFTRCLAKELSPRGVRVNAVAPGPVTTDFFANMGFEEKEIEKYYESGLKATLLNRRSEPDEIVDVVMFLASDKAKGVTGSSYLIDNGMLLGDNYIG